MIYTNCGLRLRTELDLPLPRAAGGGWDVEVRDGPDLDDLETDPPGAQIAECRTSDGRWYVATRSADGYHLRFTRCGEFAISTGLDRIEIRRHPAGQGEVLPVLLAGTVSGFVQELRGTTILHASAVEVDGAVLGFVGPSGQGKSTMAAVMCLNGAALVADDLLAVDGGPPPTCIGGTTELRLRPGAAVLAASRPEARCRTTPDGRTAVSWRQAPAGARPLGALVVPRPSRDATEVLARRRPPTDALGALLSVPRVLGWNDSDVLTRDFLTVAAVVERVPVYDVVVPLGPPFPGSVAESLRELARGRAPSAVDRRPESPAGPAAGTPRSR